MNTSITNGKTYLLKNRRARIARCLLVTLHSMLFFGALLAESLVYAGTLHENETVFVEPRYQVSYPPQFFEWGGAKVPYDSQNHLKIGVLVKDRTDIGLRNILSIIFSAAPFDRYRDFFVFTEAAAVEREIRLKNQFITAFDSYGRRIPGGFDSSATRMRAGLIVLDVNDYEWRRSGALGYAFKHTAVTQKSTILHELGHALADLGDEYSIDEQEHKEVLDRLRRLLGKEYAYRMGRGWNRSRANLEYRTRDPYKWFPLVEHGFLPEGDFQRVEIKNNHDVGHFSIPSPVCIMNNPEKSNGQFCPVCQLQIIEKIAQCTGCQTPWDDDGVMIEEKGHSDE